MRHEYDRLRRCCTFNIMHFYEFQMPLKLFKCDLLLLRTNYEECMYFVRQMLQNNLSALFPVKHHFQMSFRRGQVRFRKDQA